jgi:16S rRNA (guanine527-N7)-methyltransferase
VSADPTAVLDPAARAALAKVLELLAEERASVSSVVDQRAWKVHVADSLTGLEVPELRDASRVADVGAGAGFPGLALAVALPRARIDLVESIGRKCDFMRRAIADAGIANARVLNLRAEDLAAAAGEAGGPDGAKAGGRDAYDAVTARAVGRLSTLAELASPLLKPNGVLVAWKGKRDEEEETQLSRAAEELAMHPESILDVGNRAGSQHRHLHVIRKTGETPSNLPRKPGLAKKRPKG